MPRISSLFSLLLSAPWLLAQATLAEQPTAWPLGAEFQVNSYTTGEQAAPAVAAGADGAFVVVWQSAGADDATVESVLAQRYDASGQPLAAEFRASFSTVGDNTDPDVARRPDGDFVVVWTGPGTSGRVNFGQRFASDGSEIGGVFFTSTATAGQQGPPAVAYLPDGAFFVTWASGPEGVRDIFASRFDSSGELVGSGFQVNAYTTGDQAKPRLATSGGGEVFIVWDSDGANGVDEGSVLGKRFDSLGTQLGAELTLVAGSGFGPVYDSDIAALDDGYVLTWIGPSIAQEAALARRYDSAGAPLGSIFLASGTITDSLRPRVAVSGDQEVVITWDESGFEDGRSVRAKAFDLEAPLGASRPSFQVNTSTTGDQAQSAVAVAGDRFIVAWSSPVSAGSDSDLGSVQARLLDVAIFADGFESGSSSRWSDSVP